MTSHTPLPTPSLADLKAEYLRRRLQQTAAPAQAPLARVDRHGPLPLSWAQQRLWFLDQLDSAAGAAYHMPLGLRMKGRLDAAALRAALDRLVARHESLRTTFTQAGDQAVQVIASPDTRFPLREEDLRGVPADTREAALERLAHDETRAPFDLARGPLARGLLVRIADDDAALILTQHHIISDGWSNGVLVREVGALYTAFAQGQPDPLPPLPVQYADYAAWQRAWLQGEALQRQLVFWTEHLQDAPALLSLPTDRARPAVQSYRGAHARLVLPPALAAGVRALGARHGTTLFMTLLAAWGTLLARISGQDDVVIGTSFANRQRAEVEGLIGFFVNTLALRLRLDHNPSTAALLAQAKATTVAAHDHQDLPFEQVVEALNPARSRSHSPVFQVLLGVVNTPPVNATGLPGLQLAEMPPPHVTTQFDLMWNFTESGDRIVGNLAYATDLFDAASIDRHLAQFVTLLTAMAEDDARPVSRLPLLDAGARQAIVHGFNAHPPHTAASPWLHALFEAQVRAQPEAPALAGAAGTWSRAELNARANRLAHRLRALGVRPDDRVGVYLPRGADLIVSLLAVLKAGAAYLPLDPAYPAARIAWMLSDARPVVLLTTDALADDLPAGGLMHLLVLDTDAALAHADSPAHDPDPAACGLRPEHLAYVIYTSGSTGRPKGVMNHYAGLASLVTDNLRTFGIDAASHVLQFASCSFDASVWEIGMTLAAGAVLHLPGRDALLPGAPLHATLTAEGITHAVLPPSALAALDPASRPPALRTLICGGEALPAPLAQAWAGPVALFNAYGPTEATVCSTIHACQPGEPGPTPIGRPVAHARCYLLDRHGEPVPVGVTGELYIGGLGVARGYLHQEALTHERFVPDPFHTTPGARLYRTGDLGRWRADGAIDYQGRNDSQVKLRGFRIELGEIESRLMQCPEVAQAVVVVREDAPGDRRLVAYLVGHDGDAPDAGVVRRQIARDLAEFMLPAAFVVLDTLPQTPNGKIDRARLPAPEGAAAGVRAYEAPQGDTEVALAAIWQAQLQVPRVGRHDHFFELGGHSLKVIGLVERMRQAGLRAQVRTVFDAPTLAELAAAVDAACDLDENGLVPIPANRIPAAGCARLTPELVALVPLTQAAIDTLAEAGSHAHIQDVYPLAPLQEGLLFHHHMGEPEGRDAYLQRLVLSFDHETRLEGFVAALQQVIDRHDALRTSFRWEGLVRPVQVVHRTATLPHHRLVLQAADADAAQAEFLARTDRDVLRLDLRRAPLLAAYTAHDPAGQRWWLALLTHHLVADHVTLDLMIEEIRSLRLRPDSPLPPALPYRDFIARAATVPAAAHDAFFRAQLGDIDAPTAPFGVLDVQRDGTQVRESRRLFPAALSHHLRNAARRHAVTPAVLFHVACGVVLAQCSGRRDVVFGTVLLGRSQTAHGADRILGLFINTLPVRVSIDNRGVADAVRETYALLSELLVHEQAPLAQAQRCAGLASPEGLPLFTTLLNFRHSRADVTLASTANDPDWDGVCLHLGEERTNYPFTLSVDDMGEGFGLVTQSATGIDPARLGAMLEHAVGRLADALFDHPSRPLAALASLPQAEHEQLARFGAGERRDLAGLPAVHLQVAAQAAARPNAPALRFEGLTVGYGDLAARAARLSACLRGVGVQPGDRVALCVERGIDRVIGLLGILQAGAVYVPVDPQYPAQRRAFVLQDSAPVALLTHAALRQALELDAAAGSARVLSLDALPADGGDGQALPLPAPADDAPAYVIYTSGSTGVPKGVVNHHGGLRNLIADNSAAFGIGPESRVLQFAACSFDASLWEMLLALCSGACLVLATREHLLPGAPLEALMHEEALTHVVLTPSALAALPPQAHWPALRTLIVGGEALPPALARHWAGRYALFNAYGPTECAVCTTVHRCDTAEATASIGRPIANTQVEVVDTLGRPVPVGVVGELCIGGAGVASGYLHRPELTAERFVTDASGASHTRRYRTGDLARWREDGSLDYLGRTDTQVKIRGHRIELGEIEAALSACAGVREAVVVVRPGPAGEPRLVGYASLHDDPAAAGSPTPAMLHEQLAQRLTGWMLPAALVVLPALPLTAHGKIDRAALPAPEAGAHATRHHAPLQGEIEACVAAAWCELLGLPEVGRDDHFFALGGHSLMVMGLIERLRRDGLDIDVKTAFGTPVLRDLAAAIAARRASATRPTVPPNPLVEPADAITPAQLPLVTLTQAQIDGLVAATPGGARNLQDAYPLAPLQQGILFHHLLGGPGDTYLLRTVIRFDGRARLDSFLAALQQVVDRHDVLRTAFHHEGLSHPVQVVQRHAALHVRTLDVPAGAEARARLEAATDPTRVRLDLRAAPLLSVTLTQEAGGAWLLALLHHHLVCDHVTLELALTEIERFLAGEGAALPAPVPYRHFIAQGTHRAQAEHDAFFRTQLGDIEEPTAPYGLLDLSDDSEPLRDARRMLPQAGARAVREAAQRAGVSPGTLFHVAAALVLARASGHTDDVVFGTVVSGRLQGTHGDARALGLFINTLPLRVRLGERPIAEIVRDTWQALGALLAHEQAPLALAQRCSGLPPDVPLFTSLLNFRHSGGAESAARHPVWQGIEGLSGEERTHYPFTLAVDDLGEGFALAVQCRRADPEDVAADFEAAIAAVTAGLASDSTRPALDLVPENKADAAPAAATVQRVQTFATLPERFQAHAAARPDAPALCMGDDVLCYGALAARVNRLAHVLRRHGVHAETRVAVCAERGTDLMVMLLAVLQAGGGYVPLDPAYPAARLGFMLADSAPALVLADGAGQAALGAALATLPAGSAPTTLNLDDPALQHALATAPVHAPDAGLVADSLAYVIYTSGSTGQPKGVMNCHNGLANLLDAQSALFGVGPDSRVLQFASVSFDASISEIAMALGSGATLVLAPRPALTPGALLLDTLVRQAITHVTLSPSILAHLPEDAGAAAGLARLTLVLAGEALPTVLARRWAARHIVFNAYGPTETAVCASAGRLRAEDLAGAGLAPIGRPLTGMTVQVLDPRGRPVPAGVRGEIVIGGVGVARGYLGREALTAERFVPDPDAGPNARRYRSGDQGHWRADGTLAYDGRRDEQVKLRGMRIELGEVRSHLLRLPGVHDAVVRVHGTGDARLVAWWVPAGALGAALDATALRTELAAHLPEHGVPAAFVRLEALPLTPNGKLDAAALPAPEDSALATAAYAAPMGRVETLVATAWQELLAVERVGRNDHFFALGGHSLRVMSLVELLRQRGLPADVRTVFAHPVLHELAAAIEAMTLSAPLAVPPNPIGPECTALTPALLPLVDLPQRAIDALVAAVPGGAANVEDVYPLAPLQEGILFHHLLHGQGEGHGDAYLSRSVLRFDSQARRGSFLAALQATLDAHAVLRTAVHWDGLPQPVQVVQRRAELPVWALDLASAADAEASLQERTDPRHVRLDVRHAPLFAAWTAFDAAPAEAEDAAHPWLLALASHHLVCDHVTLELMMAEVAARLDPHAAVRPIASSPTTAYRDHIARLRAVPASHHEPYFQALLGDVDTPTAPYDLLDVQGDGSQVCEHHILLPTPLADRVRAATRERGLTPGALFHLAYAMVLARVSGRDDVVFGSVLSGRLQTDADAARTLGLFINTLPVRVRLDGRTVERALRETWEGLSGLIAHEHAPLALAQRASAVPSGTPLFSAILNYRHSALTAKTNTGTTWAGIRLRASEERSNYPFSLAVDDLGAGFGLTVQCAGPAQPATVLASMTTALEALVAALAERPDTAVMDLDVLPAAEASRLAAWEWAPAVPTAPGATRRVHELIHAVAGTQPDHAAVTDGTTSLDYATLDARATQVARQLQRLGISPDQRVGVLAPRDAWLVVGILGILKAGAAYVPLDPAYPAERLAWIAADTSLAALLTVEGLLHDAAALVGSVPVIVLDHGGTPDDCDDRPLAADLRDDHLAYVIHTSGSTGRPKGVMVEHRHLAASTRARLHLYAGAEPPRFLLLSSPAFDSSVAGLFGTLCAGGTLHLLPAAAAQDPGRIAAAIVAHRITTLLCVPSLATLVLQALPAGGAASLRDIIVAGEACPPTLPALCAALAAHATLWNEYGPTEATVWATVHRCLPGVPGPVPIGRPVPGARVQVLDGQGRRAPVGVAGEVYIGGAGVARGYLGHPALSAQRFLADPLAADPTAQRYRTGDRASWTPEGELVFHGRNDDQFKLRGYRIEPGEIESRLCNAAGVREAAVVVCGERLVAFVVTDTETDGPLADRLRAHLAAELPAHLVPAAFMRLDRLPLTPNGKADRRALVNTPTATIERPWEAPLGPTEALLATWWNELLHRPRTGRQDHFFESGGHSLTAIQLAVRLREALDVELPLAELFRTPTLAAMAENIDAHRLARFDATEVARVAAELDALTPEEVARLLAQEREFDAHHPAPLQDPIQ